MRKLISFLFLLAFNVCAYAQQNYTIEYSHFTGAEMINGKSSYSYKHQIALHIYGDTLSFCRYWSHKPKMTKTEHVMSRAANHGTLHRLKSDSVLSIATYTSDKRLIKFSQPYKWKIFSDTITIVGVKCNKAESDLGISAWFAPSIPVNAGPYIYYGLPGLILQAYDNKRETIYIADSILYDAPTLVYPKNIKIVEMAKVTNIQLN